MKQILIQRGRSLSAGVVALLASLVLAGCATGPNAHPRDPLEPLNRGVYRFNDAVDKAVLKPTATAYTKITPGFVQKGVRNFFSNLGDAWSTVNSILQLKGQDAANSFSRLTVNTLFGLGGVFDVATEARIPQSKQDFGLTLGRWGIPTGPYVVLPILGPSTVRDTVALPIDMKGNPIGAISHVGVRNALSGLSVVNFRAQLLDATNLLDQAALDPYILMRDGYLQQRDARASRGAAAGNDGAAAQPAADDGYEPPLQEDGTTSEQTANQTASEAEADTNKADASKGGAASHASKPGVPGAEADELRVDAPNQPHAGQAGQVPVQPPSATPGKAGHEPPLNAQPDAIQPQGHVGQPATVNQEEAAAVLAAPPAPAASAAQRPPVTPAVSGQTPHYWHVVPKWVDEISPGMGGSFWKR